MARWPRLRAAEFRGHGLPENHRASLAQGPDRGVVAFGEMAQVGGTAYLRWHIARFEQVLDAYRQPIDCRQRSARLPACCAGVGSGASASLVEDDKRLHHRLVCRNSLQTTFEIRPWRVPPAAEAWRGIVKGAWLEGARVVRLHCRCGHRLISL